MNIMFIYFHIFSSIFSPNWSKLQAFHCSLPLRGYGGALVCAERLGRSEASGTGLKSGEVDVFSWWKPRRFFLLRSVWGSLGLRGWNTERLKDLSWLGFWQSVPKAIYGWSYGGYLSAMCLAKAQHVSAGATMWSMGRQGSDVFKCAVAGAPVTSLAPELVTGIDAFVDVEVMMDRSHSWDEHLILL